jgi:hypothetical protein
MPTDAPFTMPPSLFGELEPFEVTEHVEVCPLGQLGLLRLQTSAEQTDNRERGTWHAAIMVAGSKTPLAQTHIPWSVGGPDEARTIALAWAQGVLAEGFTTGAREDAAIAGVTVTVGAVNGEAVMP